MEWFLHPAGGLSEDIVGVRSAGWLVCSADCARSKAIMKIGMGQVIGLNQGL